MAISILNRYTKAVLYTSATTEDIVTAVIEAIKSGANLIGADLSRANLSRANLSRANLSGANLSEADLRWANLSRAKGLLPNGLVPLQILATRDAIVVRTSGFITIGCEHHDIAWWRENCQKLGERERYNPQQIVEYRAHINYCAQWMKTYGVDQVSRCEACSGTGFTVNSGGGKEPCQCTGEFA